MAGGRTESPVTTSEAMRVLFLGNHTVGVRSLEALGQTEEVVGVVTHPPDIEDGIRYESVYDYAQRRGWRTIRCTGRNPTLRHFLVDTRPELLWITDYRYVIPTSIVHLARSGAVNLHPSLLPRYRGRAPLNWAILNGEQRLGLTAHFVDGGVDSGDIIEQVGFDLSEEQDVGDALALLYPLYASLTGTVCNYFRSGQVPRRPQDHRWASTFPARRPEDGRIDWAQPAGAILNLIRAVAFPYPGAFTAVGGCRVTVWKAARSSWAGVPSGIPGCIASGTPDGIHVECGDGKFLLLSRFEFADREHCGLDVGVLLGVA